MPTKVYVKTLVFFIASAPSMSIEMGFESYPFPYWSPTYLKTAADKLIDFSSTVSLLNYCLRSVIDAIDESLLYWMVEVTLDDNFGLATSFMAFGYLALCYWVICIS
ncbi:hypothetical protein V6N12_055530 [Hibiscus sabdariffa]|uniref:Uncharacterized protein n=1 Tax=Hibiscus sabdariffa TaxID=183260 RepID=A0ABR2BTZ3_9ROSI